MGLPSRLKTGLFFRLWIILYLMLYPLIILYHWASLIILIILPSLVVPCFHSLACLILSPTSVRCVWRQLLSRLLICHATTALSSSLTNSLYCFLSRSAHATLQWYQPYTGSDLNLLKFCKKMRQFSMSCPPFWKKSVKNQDIHVIIICRKSSELN